MRHPNDPLHIGVTDEELAWCRANREVPQAAAVLTAYASILSKEWIDRNDGDLSTAVWNLRCLRGRVPAILNHLYAYLLTLPGEGENIGSYMDPRKPGSYDTMIGADEARMRDHRDAVVICAQQGIPARLVRFERGERMSLNDLWDLPEDSERVDRLFAVIKRTEEGDEGVLAMQGKPVVVARRKTMLDVIPLVSTVARLDAAVEIRSYVNPMEVRLSEA